MESLGQLPVGTANLRFGVAIEARSRALAAEGALIAPGLLLFRADFFALGAEFGFETLFDIFRFEIAIRAEKIEPAAIFRDLKPDAVDFDQDRTNFCPVGELEPGERKFESFEIGLAIGDDPFVLVDGCQTGSVCELFFTKGTNNSLSHSISAGSHKRTRAIARSCSRKGKPIHYPTGEKRAD